MDYAYYVLSMTASFLSRIRVPIELSYALASEHTKRVQESNPRKRNINPAIAGFVTRTGERAILYQSAIDKLSTLDVELTRDVSKKAGNCELGTEKFLQMLSIADRHSINSKVLARIVKQKVGVLSDFERERFLNVVNAL